MRRSWSSKILLGVVAVLPFMLQPHAHGPAAQTKELVSKPSALHLTNKLKGVARKAASAEWFGAQRSYGLGYIPRDAEIHAVEDMRQRMIPALAAQRNLQKSMAGQLSWEYYGPDNVGGRLRGLVVNPNNASILYVGSVSGGVWKSTNAGASWLPTMNDLVTLNISALEMKPGDPNTLYAGTGEAVFNVDYFPGRGILKTTDGGNSWKRVHLDRGLNTSFISAIAVSPANPNVVYVSGRRAFPHPDNPPAETTPDPGLSAIFKSTDSGETWQDVTSGKGIDHDPTDNLDDAPMQVIVSPADANLVYATFGIFASGGIWKSSNGGQTWSRLTNGLPNSSLPNLGYGFIELAMAPSDPNTLYASFEYLKKNGDTVNLPEGAMLGLWKTTNGGQSWSQMKTPLTVNQRNRDDGNTTALGYQGRYANALIVHPTNPNIVFVGGLDIYRSTDGGNTWVQASMWISPDDISGQNPERIPYVHADHHVFVFDRSTNPPTLYNGSDGGVARSRDLGASWEILNNGLGVTQFYSFAVHPNDQRIMLGGAQDNGTQLATNGKGDEWFDAGRTGDGWANYFHANDPNVLYVAGYHLNMFRLVYDYVQRHYVSANAIGFVDGSNGITQEDVDGAEFFAPYEMSPNNPDVLVLGSNRLLRSTNRGGSWTALSTSLSAHIVAVAIAEGNENIIWFASKTGQLYKTENGGQTYTNVTGTNLPHRYLTDIEFDPANTSTVYLTYSGYGSPHVFKSANAGGSWVDITTNLPDTPANTLQVHPQKSNMLYLGTDIGAFVSAEGGQNWQPATNGLPLVPVTALVLNLRTDRVFAATHGRGIYSAPLSSNGAAILNVDAEEIKMESKPGETGTASLAISNGGDADLSFSITTTSPGGIAGLSSVPTYLASLSGVPETKGSAFPQFHSIAQQSHQPVTPLVRAHATAKPASPPVSGALAGADVLTLDDGDNGSDDFVGFGPGSANNFYWKNVFSLSSFGFRLESFDFYMRTENAATNTVYVAVRDANGQNLVEGSVDLVTSATGRWYTITINNPLQFDAGSSFSLLIGATNVIPYPAGADVDAAVPNNSYYYDAGSGSFINLNTVSGFQNGAFLIRAVGAKLGGANQPPVAKVKLSVNSAAVNESITFDASQSFDPDGQITQYLWDFGDETSSNQQVATHAYAKAGNLLVKLKVTDDKGATGQAVGFLTITPGSKNRLAVNPASGTLAPGGTQTINVTFDTQDLDEGDYQGELSIASNGGDRTLPVHVHLSNNTTRLVELAYDNGVPTNSYHWSKAGSGSAVRMTPQQVPAQMQQAKFYIYDIANGNQFNLRVLADASGTPGATIYGPVSVTAPAAGWVTVDLSGLNLTVNGDFYVMMEYNGVSTPSFSAENQPPLEKRSWDFNGQKWSLVETEDYLMRALVAYATEVGTSAGAPATVQEFALAQNYPNPFNPETMIRYQLPHRAQIDLVIFDLYGRRVAALASEWQAAGAHTVRWDGRDEGGHRVASGVYFYRLTATAPSGTSTVLTNKMTVMK